MFQNRLDIFQHEPLLKLTQVMSLNGQLRAMVTNYIAVSALDESYTVMGLSRAEVLDELIAEIQLILQQLEELDPLKREG